MNTNVFTSQHSFFFRLRSCCLLMAWLLMAGQGNGQDFNIAFSVDMPVCNDANFNVVVLPPGISFPGCPASDIEYQWQQFISDMWQDIPPDDHPIFSGSTTNNLQATNVMDDYDGLMIRLRAIKGMETGCEKFSNVLTIQVMTGMPVGNLTQIGISPTNNTLCPGPGQSYTLTAMPSDNPDQIKWYNTNPTSGSPTSIGMGATYTATMAGTYYARREGCTNSNVVSLLVGFLTNSTPPTSVTANPNPACPEVPVTLSASGGTSGTGAVLKWYSAQNGGGNSLGQGSSITVTPTAATTYYVRREGTCNTTSDASVQVMIQAAPQALTQITPSENMPCEGDAITLMAGGGTTQAGQFIRWYSGPNGSGNLGQGVSLSISEATNGSIYYARRESNCANHNFTDVSYTLATKPRPVSAFKEFAASTCVGVPTLFEAETAADITTYDWQFPGGNPASFGESGPVEVTFSNAATRTITLTVGNGSCEESTTDTITILAEPTVLLEEEELLESGLQTFTLTEKVANSLELSSNLPEAAFTWECKESLPGSLSGDAGSGSGDALAHTWTLAEGVAEAELDCTVTVTMGDCEETAAFQLLIKRLIFVPNVLSVNGDEFNQCWGIELGPDIPYEAEDFTISLYSRNGKCVRGCQEPFTVADAVLWCGEDCPAGPYWYVIEGPDNISLTGSLTLIK